MTEEDFARCQMALGRRIHEHDGIFWEEVFYRYCKPAFIFRAFEPGYARPAPTKRLVGYSHQVVSEDQSNRTVSFMVLDRRTLDCFDLRVLSSKKRNQVRRGLDNCLVHMLTDVSGYLEQMREINISQSERQESNAGAETPVSRYVDQADAWRSQIINDYSHGGREWWGALAGGRLVAYMRIYQVDGIRIIEQVKAHTGSLGLYPVDALYYFVLMNAAADQSCLQVVNGDPRHASLNHFKEQFLFRAVEYPYYSSHPWLLERVKGLQGIRLGHGR